MSYIINDNGVDRPMTDEEEAAYEAVMADVAAQRAAAAQAQAAIDAAKSSARSKLKALGLTEAEIGALIPW